MSVSPLRLAIAAWVVPLTCGALVLGIYALDANVAWPQPVGEPMPCYGTDDGDTICPEEPELEPSKLRNLASALRSETVLGVLWLVAMVGGLGSAITAVIRTRKTRREDATARLAFRVAIAALVVVVGVPLAASLWLLFVIATFPIRG